MNSSGSQKSVALFSDDRQDLIDRFFAVFGSIGCIHTQVSRDFFCLVDFAAPYRPGINFDKTNNVRVDRLDEGRDVWQHRLIAENIASARQRHMHARTTADGITNVVLEESHSGHTIPRRSVQCHARVAQ